MEVLCTKHKLSFPVVHWNEKTGRNEYGGESVSVSPKPTIQTVPDWIRDTETFKQSVVAGHVFEVNVVRPAVEPQSESDASGDAKKKLKTKAA